MHTYSRVHIYIYAHVHFCTHLFTCAYMPNTLPSIFPCVCVCVYACAHTHQVPQEQQQKRRDHPLWKPPPLARAELPVAKGVSWLHCIHQSLHPWVISLHCIHQSFDLIWLHPWDVLFYQWVIHSMSVCVCVRVRASLILPMSHSFFPSNESFILSIKWVIHSFHQMNPPFGSHYLLHALSFLL